MSHDLEDFINRNAEAFDDRIPDPAVLQRIQDQLAGGHKKKGFVISMRMVRWAAACVVILAGAGMIYISQKEKPNQTITATATNIPKPTAPNTSATEAPQKESTAVVANETNPIAVKSPGIDSYAQQVALRKKEIFAKLGDMSSPSSRVMAAGEMNKITGNDQQIVDALIHTMNEDPNTNVRIAALDALTHFNREPYVKQQLVRSLKKQNDPLVQIQLIQLLTRMRETSILDQLEKMVKDDNTMDAVKDNAYSGIMALKS